jgi:hypothetical protein
MAKRFKKAQLNDEIKSIENAMKEHCNQPGHKAPTSRREFLSLGALAAATRLLPLSLPQLMSQSAWASEINCASSIINFPTYINLQLAGGPALFANHLAHGSDGQPFANVGLLGVGASPKVERYFSNNAPFYGPDGDGTSGGRVGSGFLFGLKRRMGTEKFNQIVGGESAGTPGKAAFISVACMSIDDRLTNKHDLSGMIYNAGAGSNNPLPPILCEAGGRNVTANVGKGIKRFIDAIYPAPTYLSANTPEALAGAFGFKNSLNNNLTVNSASPVPLQTKLLEIINGLNSIKAKDLMRDPASLAGQRALREVIHCASLKNFDNIKSGGSTSFNIYDGSHAELASIWAQNFADSTGSFSAIFKNGVTAQLGTTISAALKGYAPGCTAIIGGYDYHKNQLTSREGQHNHDIFFGEVVANILLTAEKEQKAVFLYISSDGSVGSPADSQSSPDAAWIRDYGERGMNYIIAYDPNKTTTTRNYRNGDYKDGNFQLNHFNQVTTGPVQDLIVALKNPIGPESAQELAAAAVFLNFLEFSGQKSLINTPNLQIAKSKLTQAAAGMNEADIFALFSRINS